VSRARVAMLVTNRYDPDPRVQKEAASLVSAGYAVDVYAFDRQHERPASERVVTLEGVHVERLQLGHFRYGAIVPTTRGLARYRAAVKARLLQTRPDVVHCHDQDTAELGLWWQLRGATRAGKARGGRGLFVYDAHDFYWTFLLRDGQHALWRRAGAQALRLRERVYAQRADLLLTVTEGSGRHPGTAELYRAWGRAPVVLWNAPRALAPEQVPPLPTIFTLGYFGAVRDAQMFRWLLEAIGRLPAGTRPALRVAGGGTAQREVAELLEAASRRLGFACEVSSVFGMHELSGLMAQCSTQFCVYARDSGNIDRALPVKLLDAVVHGRTVIANADTLMGDLVQANRWGFVASDGDVAGLARAIEDARATPLHAARPAPSWEEQADKLVDAYARLLHR
jgi:glycosyltransferase involved in cell wall biosynthesis